MSEGKTALEYRAAVDDSLDKHGILSKTFCFTTDNEPTMNAAFAPFERNGCFAHIESKASEKALESSNVLKKVREKLRKVAMKSNKSPKFKRFLKTEQMKRKLRTITLKQEVATRFTSTKIMFNSFAPTKSDQDEVQLEEAKLNIEAINAALKDTQTAKEYKKLAIEDKDMDVVVNILPTLKILEEGITRIGGEKYSTGSIVLPFLSKFLDFLEGDEADAVYVRDFKKELQMQMITRCKENLNIELLALSSFCDMRHSHLRFLKNLEKFKVHNISKESIIEIFRGEMEKIEEDNDDLEISSQPKKKKQRKSFFDDDEEELSPEDKSVKYQLENYLKETPIKKKECPGAWWRMNETKYPTISRLARKHLATQGTSTSAERVMSDMGTILNKKRLSMTDENFRMLMYLGDID